LNTAMTPVQQSFWTRLKKNYQKHSSLYWIALPVVLYFIIFKYIPMFGVIIAFQDFRPGLGFLGSKWIGFKHFVEFLTNPVATRTIWNTLRISFVNLIFGFPAPIILALLLNEVRFAPFKKTVQTLSYMPHFISTVVVCGMIKEFTLSTGVITDVCVLFGLERQALLANVDFWVPIYVISGIWQQIGWGSILYLATLSGTDPNLYEAAVIDGAGRWKQALHVTLPTLVPIIILQLIMRVGSMMSVGHEKTILLYSPLLYSKADIISSFVYRRGLQEMSFSFGSAVGLFNSAVNLTMLVFSNWFSRKVSGESMW